MAGRLAPAKPAAVHVEHDLGGLAAGSLVAALYRRAAVIAPLPRPAAPAGELVAAAWVPPPPVAASAFSSAAAQFGVAPVALAPRFALEGEVKIVF